jgi:hypothetical protein
MILAVTHLYFSPHTHGAVRHYFDNNLTQCISLTKMSFKQLSEIKNIERIDLPNEDIVEVEHSLMNMSLHISGTNEVDQLGRFFLYLRINQAITTLRCYLFPCKKKMSLKGAL